MKRIPIISLIILWCQWVNSQTIEFKGQLLDENGRPVINIPIQISSENGSNRFRVESDTLGIFKISNLIPGTYYIKARQLGYESLNESVSIDSNFNFVKQFFLITKREQLQEVTVKDKKNIAKVKSDTLQFDANSFKTMGDASAEQLVDKVPTITKENGVFKAQGEDLKQVLVDGKPFFGTDPNLALKNLPADLIDKVQIFDQLSEQSQFTGVNDGNTLKTINIVTKYGLNNGQFGKVYAGYGIPDKYQMGANYNLFDGSRRVSLIGMSNNINVQNFAIDDILSVVGNSGNSRNRGGGPSNFQRPTGNRENRGNNSGGPGDFLVPQSGGVSKSHAIGINFTENYKQKLELNFSYFYNKNTNQIQNELDRDYLEDGKLNQQYFESGQSKPINQNHRLNARIEYKIDSFNSFVLRPRLTIQSNNSSSALTSQTYIRDTLTNSSDAIQNIDNIGLNFSNTLLFRHKFSKQGRSFSIESGQSLSPKNEKSNLKSITEYLNKSKNFIDTINQQSENKTGKWSLNHNLEYTEPINLKHSITVNYKHFFQKEENDLETIDIPLLDGIPKQLNLKLSNHFISKTAYHSPGIGYQFNKEQILNFNIRVNYQISHIDNEQLVPVNNNKNGNYYNILPSAFIRYNINRNKNLQFNYRSYVQLPSVSQLQNVINNTNPIHLTTGNPNLNQTSSHHIVFRYSATHKDASVLFISLSGSITKDYITNHLFIRSRAHPIFNVINVPIGSQLSIPENNGNSYQSRCFITYSLPIPYIKCNFAVDGSYQFTKTPGWIDSLKYTSDQNNISCGISLSSNIGPKLDFGLQFRPSYNFYASQNTEDNYFFYDNKIRIAWQFYRDFIFRGDFNSKSNQSVINNQNETVNLLNLAFGMKLFKNKRGEISLGINDLFNQNENIQQIVTDSYIEDSRSNSIKRFLLFSFTYNIKNYNTGKAPGIPLNPDRDRERMGRWDDRRF